MKIDNELMKDFLVVMALSIVLSVVYGAFAVAYARLRKIPTAESFEIMAFPLKRKIRGMSELPRIF